MLQYIHYAMTTTTPCTVNKRTIFLGAHYQLNGTTCELGTEKQMANLVMVAT